MPELKFMEPQSRWVINALFRRNYDAFTDEARRLTNWLVLAADIVVAYVVLQALI